MSGLFRIDRTGRRCYLQRCREAGDWTLGLSSSFCLLPFAFCLLPSAFCLFKDNVMDLKENVIELENYFDFLNPEDIRIKRTRIGIETVLEDYLEGISPEEIATRYRNLTLEQVYAVLLYYFRNRAEVDAYLEAWRAYTEQAWLEQQRNPSPAIRRLRELKARRAALKRKGKAKGKAKGKRQEMGSSFFLFPFSFVNSRAIGYHPYSP